MRVIPRVLHLQNSPLILPHKPGKRPGRIKEENDGTHGDGQAPENPEIPGDLQLVVLWVA